MYIIKPENLNFFGPVDEVDEIWSTWSTIGLPDRKYNYIKQTREAFPKLLKKTMKLPHYHCPALGPGFDRFLSRYGLTRINL